MLCTSTSADFIINYVLIKKREGSNIFNSFVVTSYFRRGEGEG